MNLLPLLVLSSCAPVVMSGSRVAVSLTALHEGASPATVGLIVAVYGFLPIFFSLPAGRLIDRIGLRVPLIGCSVIFLCGLLAAFAWPSLGSLVVCAAACGIGFMASTIAANKGVPAVSPPERRTANFGWLTLATSAGGAAGPFIAGFGIEHFGHRNVFLLFTVVPLFALAVLLGFRRSFSVPPVEARKTRGPLLELLRERRLRHLLILTACVPALLDLYFFVIPVMHAAAAVPASVTGVVLGVCAIAMFAVRGVLPWLLRCAGQWTLVALSYLAMGLAFLLLPLAQGPAAMLAPALLVGIGSGVGTPVLLSLYYAASPAGRQGELMGVRSGLFNGLSGFLPMVTGAFSTLIGMAPILVVTGIGIMLGGGSAWRERGRG